MAGPGEFDLLPPDPGLINPDLELEAALAPVVTLGEKPLAPLGKGWAFDFLARRFVRRGSAPAEVFEIDNLRMWIEKTLRTARYAHPVYTDAYGMVEPDQVIGNPYSSRMLASYRKAVVDALLVHDRIVSVDDFVFESGQLDDALYVTFTVTLDSEAEEMFTVSSLPLAPTLR